MSADKHLHDDCAFCRYMAARRAGDDDYPPPAALPESPDCYVCAPEHHSGEHYGCTGCLTTCDDHGGGPTE